MEESDKSAADVCGRHWSAWVEKVALQVCVYVCVQEEEEERRQFSSFVELSEWPGREQKEERGKERLLAVTGHTVIIIILISFDASFATTMLPSGPKRSHYAEQAQVGVSWRIESKPSCLHLLPWILF